MQQSIESTVAVPEINLLLSIQRAAQRLKVTRVTLYKWISMGLISPQGNQTIGDRHLYWFDPAYIEKIADLLPKARRRGFSLLNSKLEEKLKHLSKH